MCRLSTDRLQKLHSSHTEIRGLPHFSSAIGIDLYHRVASSARERTMNEMIPVINRRVAVSAKEPQRGKDRKRGTAILISINSETFRVFLAKTRDREEGKFLKRFAGYAKSFTMNVMPRATRVTESKFLDDRSPRGIEESRLPSCNSPGTIRDRMGVDSVL